MLRIILIKKTRKFLKNVLRKLEKYIIIFNLLNLIVASSLFLNSGAKKCLTASSSAVLSCFVNPIVINTYGQHQELEADRIAIWILNKGRRGMAETQAFREFLKTLLNSPRKEKPGFSSNYPLIKRRIRQIDQIIAGKVKSQHPLEK